MKGTRLSLSFMYYKFIGYKTFIQLSKFVVVDLSNKLRSKNSQESEESNSVRVF